MLLIIHIILKIKIVLFLILFLFLLLFLNFLLLLFNFLFSHFKLMFFLFGVLILVSHLLYVNNIYAIHMEFQIVFPPMLLHIINCLQAYTEVLVYNYFKLIIYNL